MKIKGNRKPQRCSLWGFRLLSDMDNFYLLAYRHYSICDFGFQYTRKKIFAITHIYKISFDVSIMTHIPLTRPAVRQEQGKIILVRNLPLKQIIAYLSLTALCWGKMGQVSYNCIPGSAFSIY